GRIRDIESERPLGVTREWSSDIECERASGIGIDENATVAGRSNDQLLDPVEGQPAAIAHDVEHDLVALAMCSVEAHGGVLRRTIEQEPGSQREMVVNNRLLGRANVYGARADDSRQV